MNEQKIFNTERYLDKAYQSKKDDHEELNATTERLSTPFGRIDYKENDSVELSTKEFQLKFEYAQMDEESRKNVQEFLERIKEHHDYVEDKFLDIDEWREIGQLEVDFKKGNENKIDFQKIMPSDYKIFFFPNEKMINGWHNGESKSIYIIGSMASPITLITILHEIGHGWDDKKTAEIGEDKLFTDNKHIDSAKRLRQERYATAFALKAIKPFFDRGNILRKDALAFLKNYALESYNDEVKSILARSDFLHHTLGKDMLEEERLGDQQAKDWEMYNEFLEWRNSDEYKEWKKLDKYKDADEFVEYGLWQEWCEETGRAWWREYEKFFQK
jgi:hypothetical protein